jgi:predicted ester cyclase
MSDVHSQNQALLDPLRAAQYDWDTACLQRALMDIADPAAVFHLSHPFGDIIGPEAFCQNALAPLADAWPDIERRDWLVMAGEDQDGQTWVGCGGHFYGTFSAPLLDIPPTGHLCHMRFHEFYRFEGNRVVEYQAIWDLPEVIKQAGAWPMTPSLGREFCVPGPASGDGLARGSRDQELSDNSRALILQMLDHMTKHPVQGGPEVMELNRFWHPRMNWYGPAGIGTGRGISGFRNWHQIPFLNAMPDRGQNTDKTTFHFFADNEYVAVTGWPNMAQTLSHDGWLGLVPTRQEITLRSLDFWRIENRLIRENWVLVDLLDVYQQLGVDVFARLREFNKARVSGCTALHKADPAAA